MRITDIPEFHDRAEVLTLPPETALTTAAKEMKKRSCGAAIVVNKDHSILGIFTERDLLMKVAAEGKAIKGVKLKDVMTKNPKTAKITDDVEKSMRRMSQGKFRHLPIVDEDGKVTGMVSQGDFVALTWYQIWQRLTTQTKSSFLNDTQIWLLIFAFFAWGTIMAFLA